MSNNYAVILCGGSGSRLWPLSRTDKPKQFLRIDCELTLLQKTFTRLASCFKKENIYIVTHEKFYFEVIGQLTNFYSSVQQNIIKEPSAKNTLPAITYATKIIYTNNPNATIGVFSSDHEIVDDNQFTEAINKSIILSKEKNIILLGIKPYEINTGFGYIEMGDRHNSNLDDVFKIKEFYEKPNKTKAKEFIEKDFLWNSGIFVFNANFYIELLAKIQPKIFDVFFKRNISLDTKDYEKLPNLSIDYGLLEKTKEILVIKTSLKWIDLGTWNSLHNFMLSNNKSDNNMAIKGDVYAKDSNNCLVWSETKKTFIYGLKDLIVVNDVDATFVCTKEKADDMKLIINEIKKNDEKIVNEHPVVNRPWGFYIVLYEGKNFKIKSITVKPKHKLSLQLHHHRNEHWVVIRGVASVTKGNSTINLKCNESTYINSEVKHRLANNTDDILEVIEVSLGDIIDENDIVRFNDDYGRKK